MCAERGGSKGITRHIVVVVVVVVMVVVDSYRNKKKYTAYIAVCTANRP